MPSNLLVRVPNWIGDAVMCLPALWDLHDFYPHAKLTILARPTIAALLRGQPGIDEVITYQDQQEHKGFRGLLRLIRHIRTKRFDIAVLFQNAFEAALIAFLAGIPVRIGYATDGRHWLLSRGIPKPVSQSLHHTQYYQMLVQEMTREPPRDRAPHISAPVVDDQKWFGQLLEACPSSTVLIGINPGAVFGSAKRWMAERFARAGDQLVERIAKEIPEAPLVRCVVFGGKGEEGIGNQIAEQMIHAPIVLSGKTTIEDCVGLLARCSLLVTNDTGPMHIAQALGVPVVAVFGSTNPQATGPWGMSQGVVCAAVRCAPCLLRSCPIDHRCMLQISVAQVVEVGMAQIRSSDVFVAHKQAQGHVG